MGAEIPPRAERVVFFDRAALTYDYVAGHYFAIGEKESILGEVAYKKAPLFWYAYEKNHLGDIVLYEYQSDIFDKDVKTEIDAFSLYEDIKNQSNPAILDESVYDTFYNKSASAVSDNLNYGYRIPSLLKKYLAIELEYSNLLESTKGIDEDLSTVVDIAENKIMPFSDLQDLRFSNKKPLFQLISKHAFKVFQETGDFNKAINSYKDIIDFKLKSDWNYETVLHEFKVWARNKTNFAPNHKMDYELEAALFKDMIQSKSNRKAYFKILKDLFDLKEVSESDIVKLNEDEYRKIISRYQRIKTPGFVKEKDERLFIQSLKKNIINNDMIKSDFSEHPDYLSKEQFLEDFLLQEF